MRLFQKEITEGNGTTQTVTRSEWVVDENIPVFIQDRGYVTKFLEIPDARS